MGFPSFAEADSFATVPLAKIAHRVSVISVTLGALHVIFVIVLRPQPRRPRALQEYPKLPETTKVLIQDGRDLGIKLKFK